MKTKEKKTFVYVVAGRYQDRHGDEGLNGPDVFSTLTKAAKYLAAETEAYLKYHYGLLEDGKIDYDTVNYIDGENSILSTKDILPYIKENEAISIDIDGEGTWADWAIFKEEVH